MRRDVGPAWACKVLTAYDQNPMTLQGSEKRKAVCSLHCTCVWHRPPLWLCSNSLLPTGRAFHGTMMRGKWTRTERGAKFRVCKELALHPKPYTLQGRTS